MGDRRGWTYAQAAAYRALMFEAPRINLGPRPPLVSGDGRPEIHEYADVDARQAREEALRLAQWAGRLERRARRLVKLADAVLGDADA